MYGIMQVLGCIPWCITYMHTTQLEVGRHTRNTSGTGCKANKEVYV